MFYALIWFSGEEGFNTYKLHGYDDQADAESLLSRSSNLNLTVQFGQVDAILTDVPVHVNMQHATQFMVITEEQFDELQVALQVEADKVREINPSFPFGRR